MNVEEELPAVAEAETIPTPQDLTVVSHLLVLDTCLFEGLVERP